MEKIIKTMDGCTAAAYASYAFTEVAGIYPITPSTPIAEYTDQWSAEGKVNIFGQTVDVVEMQSEAGAAATVHGSLQSGALTTTYTASQGLLLMIPNMYKIAGELLPGVLHVTARAVAAHALSIFGDHSDVMACRQTGFAFLASANVQEAMDLGAVAHLAAIKSRVPFLHFFDGFRTSSEMQKIECLNYEDLKGLVDMEALEAFRQRALNPEHPVLRGTAQNPDIFFQAKEASNPFYDATPEIVQEYMNEINKLTGKDYKLFNYYGAEDAERVIIAMGSSCDAIEETVDYLNKQGEKVGCVKVHLYRPFSAKHFMQVVPKSVKSIAVLDRCKEAGALGEPLYQDVCTVYFEEELRPTIVAGRYGLGSKDVTPAQILAVYKNLKQPKPKNHFTIGIVDDVTHHSLELDGEVDITPEGTISCKIWGLGSDGTIGANKNSIKIIGDIEDMQVQAYFSYDSKKSGGVTRSHLRFGKERIRSTYLVNIADFIACHKQSYLYKYDVIEGLKEGGKFLLNCIWEESELEEKLPANLKRYIAENNIEFYTIDATGLAKDIGLGNRVNTVLQAAFFEITKIVPIEHAVNQMKDAITSTYGKKGASVLEMNYKAVDAGVKGVRKITVPAHWANLEAEEVKIPDDIPEFVKKINFPIDSLRGDFLPVSTFKGIEDGTFMQGTSQFEKRAIAVEVPCWIKDNCIQCNQCVLACPHATIRPFLVTADELKDAPDTFESKKATGKGLEDYEYTLAVNQLDCSGCHVCAQVCPSKQKALVMKPIEEEMPKYEAWEFSRGLKEKENPLSLSTVKGSQFEQPLLEYSGACSGCGETPYAKLLTQLFGDRMVIANATGCSSIWTGSAPSTPYTTNSKGHGPAWANSLFEDNAEFGFGLYLGTKKIREGIALNAGRFIEISNDESVKAVLSNWLDVILDGEKSKIASAELVRVLESKTFTGEEEYLKTEILKRKDNLVKKSQWMFGGDGWAYDIGFGGLDHVIATGEDVNILVFDTEIYSNTGGQASKSTPTGAIAKLAAAGKNSAKKDLGLIAMSYGNVYVAQIGLGANQAQTIKAIVEAESYPGPSIIIAYSPCISHGIRGGMGMAQAQIKRAVEAGYWSLYRYNPLLAEKDENPFILDSKPPTADFEEFLDSENRYSALKRSNPERAKILYAECEASAKKRYSRYVHLSENKF